MMSMCVQIRKRMKCNGTDVLKAGFFNMPQQPPVGQGLLIIEDVGSHSEIGRTPLDE